jgi:hypothetical protein
MSDWELEPPAKSISTPAQPAVATSAGERAALAGRPARAAGPPPEAGAADVKTARRRFPYEWAAMIAVILIVGMIAGFFIGRSQYSGDAAALVDANGKIGELQASLANSEDRNWTYYRSIEGLKGELAQATSTTLPVMPGYSPPPASYSDGVYLVGTNVGDIPPGTYNGVVDGSIGYWARLKGTDGSIASIIENAIPRGPFVVTIAPADNAVELRGVTLKPQ